MEIFTYSAKVYRTIQQEAFVEHDSTINLTEDQSKEALQQELDKLDDYEWTTLEVDDTSIPAIQKKQEYV
jgi:hypothetical protein